MVTLTSLSTRRPTLSFVIVLDLVYAKNNLGYFFMLSANLFSKFRLTFITPLQALLSCRLYSSYRWYSPFYLNLFHIWHFFLFAYSARFTIHMGFLLLLFFVVRGIKKTALQSELQLWKCQISYNKYYMSVSWNASSRSPLRKLLFSHSFPLKVIVRLSLLFYLHIHYNVTYHDVVITERFSYPNMVSHICFRWQYKIQCILTLLALCTR